MALGDCRILYKLNHRDGGRQVLLQAGYTYSQRAATPGVRVKTLFVTFLEAFARLYSQLSVGFGDDPSAGP